MIGFVDALHIAGGTVVLGAAPAALIVRTGGRWHKRLGRIFACAMLGVIITAAFMWQPYGHTFLLFLDGVCAYLLYSGYRSVARHRRRVRKVVDRRADLADAVAALVAFALAVIIVAIAFTDATPLMRSLAAILVALAGVAVAFSVLDVKAIRTRVPMPIGWLLTHLSAMIAVYISAVTAFVVINVHQVPMALRWIVPSLIGSIVIGVYSVRFRRAARRLHAG